MGIPFFTNKAKLKNHLSDIAEIGFSKYGPTLGLSGVLTSSSKVIFVQNIALNILRKKDNSQYLFDWFAFRPTKFSATGYSQIEFKMPSKFMISSSQPFKYNILFIDQNKYAEMNPTLQEIKRNWQKLLEAVKFDSVINKYQELFEEFSNHQRTSELLYRLNKLSYWEEGEYSLTIIITTRDKKYLEIQKSFTLEKSELKTLEENTLIILYDLCKQITAKYKIIPSKLK